MKSFNNYVYYFLLCFVAIGSCVFAYESRYTPYEFDMERTYHPDLFNSFRILEDIYYTGKKSYSKGVVKDYLNNTYTFWVPGLYKDTQHATSYNEAKGALQVTSTNTNNWAGEIILNDKDGKQFGKIDIHTVKDVNGKAKNSEFTFYEYDDQGNYINIGIGYYDSNDGKVIILLPGGGSDPIVEMEKKGVFLPDGWYLNKRVVWTIKVHKSGIDDRLISIFVAFFIDSQDDFHNQP